MCHNYMPISYLCNQNIQGEMIMKLNIIKVVLVEKADKRCRYEAVMCNKTIRRM